jgi:hypothetical protein
MEIPKLKVELSRLNNRVFNSGTGALPAWGRPGCGSLAAGGELGGVERSCRRARPDAFCWGHLNGHETLAWLEVESGHDLKAWSA